MKEINKEERKATEIKEARKKRRNKARRVRKSK